MSLAKKTYFKAASIADEDLGLILIFFKAYFEFLLNQNIKISPKPPEVKTGPHKISALKVKKITLQLVEKYPYFM